MKSTENTSRAAGHFAALLASAAVILLGLFVNGCRTPDIGGSPTQPPPLGSVLDEVNRIQEDNAELAKLIVYVHEFELNKPRKVIDEPWSRTEAQVRTNGRQQTEPRGFRLNDDGMDHVRRLARRLQIHPENQVIVQRSRSSKKWDTVYQYPVHLNAKLDQERRKTVVAALEALGIQDAESLVIVADAFPTGQEAQEAARAYNQLWSNGGGTGGSGQGGSGQGGSSAGGAGTGGGN